MSKTFIFDGENIVISKIDSVYVTNIYGEEGYRDRYIDVIIIVNGRKLRESFYCGYETFDDIFKGTEYEKKKSEAIAKAGSREKQILGYINTGKAPKE